MTRVGCQAARLAPEHRLGWATECQLARKEALHLAAVNAQARHKDLLEWSQDRADLVEEWLALDAPSSTGMNALASSPTDCCCEGSP